MTRQWTCQRCHYPAPTGQRYCEACAAVPTLFDPDLIARARRTDPAPSRAAAAVNLEGKASQATRLLRWMYDHGLVTADTANRELTYEDEEITRGDWSTRLGGLCAGPHPLAEKAGLVKDTGRKGLEREVVAYRLTVHGRAEVERMLSGSYR